MAISDTLINTLFDGRYRILRKLGAGGMANVYLAEDEDLGRRVAIKILNERHANDESFVERFRREAKHAAGLSHPNIVSIYDRGEAEGTYYIAMEYLEGRSLKELIASRGPAPVSIAIEYVRQILAALRVSHRTGVIHRDIKPHNVLVDGEGRLKVTDFGIARAGPSQMTEAGSIVGTAQYLSPEQAQGAPVSESSDLYSVGIVLYELLTGEVPFSGDSPVEIAMKHLSKVPATPSRLRPEIPHDLDLVVMRALAKDPEDRYQSADEMDADLARVARGLHVSPETEETATAIIARPIAPPTVVTPRRPPPPAYEPDVYYEEPVPRRRSLWPWLLALVLLIAAGIAGVYAYQQIQDELNASRPVTVGKYEEMREADAVRQILAAGLRPDVRRRPHPSAEETFVFDQDPSEGQRIERGNSVTIFVSQGKPMTVVPDVRGRSRDDAAAMLARAGLEPRVIEISSREEINTVLAQDPAPGERVVRGSRVRINVSKGPAQIAVPPVVGKPYEQASSELQGRNFAVRRRDVDSNEPAGTVVGQTPEANTFAAEGSIVTLRVSKGPKTRAVPSVEGQEREAAAAALEDAGFQVEIVEQEVEDPNLENLVLSQQPAGGTQAKPGSKVTIVVGIPLPELPPEEE
ncbi:MAG: Stk1 family PASTA domain-containing Ser/Thr kinase [Actinomycetota bacterium]|nr:Stk1 family PASTA domain-containing Ser/Thr kinase [Actinomycetota bacterium]